MDGLPAIPGTSTPAPFAGATPAAQATFQQPAVPGRSPGRPPADPQVAADRDARHAETRRLESILPKSATDSKIQVFRCKEGRVPMGAKPILVVLASELEEATSSGGEPEQFITDRLVDKIESKGGDATGIYQCRTVDKHNKLIPNFAPWELVVGDPRDDAPEGADDDDDDADDQGAYAAGYDAANDQMARSQHMFTPAAVPPPVAPATDAVRVAQALREERAEEAKRGESMVAVITTMMSAQAQAQQAAQQNMQNMVVQMQTMQMQMAEQARKDSAEREERERTRSAEFRNTLLSLVPVMLPVVQGLFKRDPDPTMPVLLEMIRSKPTDSAVMPAIMAMMTETMKASNEMQSKAATSAMEQQSKVTGQLTDVMLEKVLALAKVGGNAPEPKEEGMLSQLAALAPLIGPLLAAQQQQQPQPQQALPAPAPVQANPEADAAAERPRRRRVAVPQAPGTQAQAPATPEERIRAVMQTVVRLSTGDIPVTSHGKALVWCVREGAPTELLTAIQSGDQDKILAVGAPVIGSDQALVAWITDPANAEFLKGCLVEMKHIIDGTYTPALAKAGARAQAAHLSRRSGAPPADAPQAPAATQEAPQAPPASPQAPAPKQDLPIIAGDAPIVTFQNTTGALVRLPAEVLTDTGWVPAQQTLDVPDNGNVRGPQMDENDASWVIMVAPNARARVAKDKFKRLRSRKQQATAPAVPSVPETPTGTIPGQQTLPGVGDAPEATEPPAAGTDSPAT